MAKSFKSCSIDGCNRLHHAHGWCKPHYKRWRRHGDPLGGSTKHGNLVGERAANGEPLRFIHEVALAYEGEECLIWPFGRDGNGRGKVHVEGKDYGAHRVVCRLTHGEPPTPEHEAAHSCGKGHEGCISPHHLSWKTHAENEADKLIHGTHSRGERHPLAKLNASDVDRIRSLRGKLSQPEIARQFGVSVTHVSYVQNGRSWAPTAA